MISPPLERLLREHAGPILDAHRQIRVLRALGWPEAVERDFFAAGATRLPQPVYREHPDLGGTRERLADLERKLGGDNEIERMLRETVRGLHLATRMLEAVGTRDFYFHSVELYGRPGSLSADRRTTNLDLARHFDQVIGGFHPPPDDLDQHNISAEDAVVLLKERFERFFVGREIRVSLVDDLAAQASASADEIRVKRGVKFSRRDLLQIHSHEGQVHVATALNGRAQPVLPFLGYPSPRSTGTQEGLAVLTEFLTGATSLLRLRRLSDRTLAIHMAEQGANFIDLYQFFVSHGHDEQAAFDNARRVCRGGLVEGGAPFTKDVCYLDGLLRVTNFLRVALVKGASQLVPLLFAGKVALDDVPLLARLQQEGLIAAPVWMPEWARDLSGLTAFMGYAAFLGESDLAAERLRLEDGMLRASGEL